MESVVWHVKRPYCITKRENLQTFGRNETDGRVRILAKKILRLAGKLFAIWLIYFAVCMVIPPLVHLEALPEAAGSESAGSVQSETGSANRTAADDGSVSDAQKKAGTTASSAAEQERENGLDYAAEQELGNVPCYSAERVRSIDDNPEALLWRLRLIEAAQERIVLTTFDLRDDNSGRDIMAALYHSAQRGVKIQMIVDGMNGVLRLSGSESFEELSSHENVEIKLYNPITLLKPWKNNYRMHDKYVIADDFAYLLGGRNTDDLFLGSYTEVCNADRDILVYETNPGEGQSLRQLEAYFEEIWALPCCKTVETSPAGSTLEAHYEQLRTAYPEAFTETDWEAETMEARSVELCTNPINAGSKRPQLWQHLVTEMQQADDVVIQTPYIICSKPMYRDLTELCESGVQVDLIINAVESGTNPFGCTDYLNQRRNVQKTGVWTYEYLGAHAQHTKTVLADDHISIVGSCNVDMRSVYLDTEMMLVIDSSELNRELREQAEALKERSRCVSPDGAVTDGEAYEPRKQSAGQKIVYTVLRVLILPLRHLL